MLKITFKVYNYNKITSRGNKGGGLMYPNLEAEIARQRLTNKDCASICGISEKTFSNKRAGRRSLFFQK